MPTVKRSGIVERWIHALTDDLSAFHELCAPDCKVWHSSDARWMSFKDAVDAVSARGGLPGFDAIRTIATENGFVLQTSTIVEPLGKTHIMQVVTVRDGKVTAVEEYIAPEMHIAG